MSIEIFLATVSALSSVTQLMMKQQDRLDQFRILEKRSADARPELPPGYQEVLGEMNDDAKKIGAEAYANAKSIVAAKPEIASLERRIPPAILDAMTANVERCWSRLQHFISDDQYTPIERRISHMRARQCVCDELQELLNYLGSLPDDLQAYWNACNCAMISGND